MNLAGVCSVFFLILALNMAIRLELTHFRMNNADGMLIETAFRFFERLALCIARVDR